MKELTKYLAEGLLDKDFDGPDFNIDLITPNIPAFIQDGEDWQNQVDDINKKLAPYSYFSQINNAVRTAKDVMTTIQKNSINVVDLGKLGTALGTLAKCDLLEINEDTLQKAKDIRALNEWIGKANDNVEFKKFVSGLGGYFYASVGKRAVRGGTIYGFLSYTLTSPNENAQLHLVKIAEKLSKVNPAIECKFATNGEGDGVFHARLIRHIK